MQRASKQHLDMSKNLQPRSESLQGAALAQQRFQPHANNIISSCHQQYTDILIFSGLNVCHVHRLCQTQCKVGPMSEADGTVISFKGLDG